MPAEPIITSLVTSNQNVHLSWRGFAGPYQVLQNTNLRSSLWSPAGSPTSAKTARLPKGMAPTFFQVTGPEPEYAGAEACAECHFSIYRDQTNTAHAGAFQALKQQYQDRNASCLACHTVGYGLSTGFIDEATTPHLAGVQCENCHGPAAAHAANPVNRSVRPLIETSSKLCGGCHTEAHQPAYDEWEHSPHGEFVEELVTDFLSTNLVSVTNRMLSCGKCHSGEVRDRLLAGEPLPSGSEAVELAIRCVTCHNPHKHTVYGNQLRYPLYSTNSVSYATSVALTNQHDPSAHLCGQCHNVRGAQWTDTSRPPHHSPQYNILLASAGIVTNSPLPPTALSPHWKLEKQCVTCHMQSRTVSQPTEENPNYTGHGFRVTSLEVCYNCHDDPEWKLGATQEYIELRVSQVKSNLDLWATTKAPASLRNKYGPLVWEYTTPGEISNPTGSPSLRGPTTAEQTNNVPVAIRQARFNLYLVEYGSSSGVHNAAYARYLLRVAEGFVKAELEK
jgi:hypothetical protein